MFLIAGDKVAMDESKIIHHPVIIWELNTFAENEFSIQNPAVLLYTRHNCCNKDLVHHFYSVSRALGINRPNVCKIFTGKIMKHY